MAFQKIGCGGFPVSRERYFQELKTVEIASTFLATPKLSTVEIWKKEAPAGFEFSMRASQIITHPADSRGYAKILRKIPERRRNFCGHFKPAPEVDFAWEATRAAAETLGARFVVFETPPTFYPDANHLRDFYRFFKSIRRTPAALVWHPRGSWEPRMIGKVCADLGLILAADPVSAPQTEVSSGLALNYFRLPGLRGGGVYSETQLREVARRCGNSPSYVFFTHRSSWHDARRFAALAKSGVLR